jgi:predicted Zn-dependent peptidase
MENISLDNGLKIIYKKKRANSVCIEVNVKVGSNNETADEAGISHFIEHMLFEGTKKRANSYLISNEIEKLGGDLNAATSNERTFYYCKVPNKHFEVALDVISDIIINPEFKEEFIEKEKKIVIDEINLVNDQPRYYQWVMFEKALFVNHPAKNPIYGKKEVIESLTREKIVDYYSRYYLSNNMTIVIVGDVDDHINHIKKKFDKISKGDLQKKKEIIEPKQTTDIKKEEFKDILQAYTIIGFKTVPRNHKDSYVLDVIRAILGRGQSGKIFNEVRNKRGLAYDVGVYHSPSTDFGFFAVYANSNKEHVEKIKEIVLAELEKMKDVTSLELKEAKTFLEGEFLLEYEENNKMADLLAFWDQMGDVNSAFDYVDKIKKITAKDIKHVIEKHFKHHTMTVISKDTEENQV